MNFETHRRKCLILGLFNTERTYDLHMKKIENQSEIDSRIRLKSNDLADRSDALGDGLLFVPSQHFSVRAFMGPCKRLQKHRFSARSKLEPNSCDLNSVWHSELKGTMPDHIAFNRTMQSPSNSLISLISKETILNSPTKSIKHESAFVSRATLKHTRSGGLRWARFKTMLFTWSYYCLFWRLHRPPLW